MVGRVASPRFVGRQADVDALRTVVSELAAGARLILVAGDAGIGKSRYLTEAVAAITSDRSSDDRHRRGLRVVTGACIELAEGSIPYAPIIEILEDLVRDADDARRDVARRLIEEFGGSGKADDAPASAEQGRASRFGRMRDVLAAIASERDLVVIIDDLHWADSSTLDLIRYLVRGLRASPVAIVLAYRSDAVHRRHPLHAWLAESERSAPVVRIDLRPLNDAAVAAQIEAITGTAPDPRVLADVLAVAEGNPFHVEELIASGDSVALTPSLRAVMLARIDELDRSTAQVLRVAAVIGRDWDERLAAVALPGPIDVVREAMRQAVARFIVEPASDGRRYRFRHALLREAVYDELLPGDRVDLHRRIAEALVAEPELAAAGSAAAAAERAHHLAASRQDAAAFVSYLEAGRTAQAASAWAEASIAFERALELESDPTVSSTSSDTIDPVALRRSAAIMAFLAGRPRYALETLRQAVTLARERGHRTEAIELLAQTAYVAAECGEWAEMEQAAAAAYAAAPSEPTIDRAIAVGILGGARMQVGRSADAVTILTEAIDIERNLKGRDAEVALARSLATIAIPSAALGHADRARASIDEAMRLSEALDDADALGIAIVNHVVVLGYLGRFVDSVASADEGLAIARRLGVEASLGPWLVPLAAIAEFWVGRWTEAHSRLADEGEPAPGISSNQHIMPVLARESLAAARGDAGAAARVARLADRVAATATADQSADLRSCAALGHLWHRRPDDALEQVRLGLVALTDRELSVEAAWLLAFGMRAAADIATRERALARDAEAILAEADEMLARLRSLADGSFAVGAAAGPLPGSLLRLATPERARAHDRPDVAGWDLASQEFRALEIPILAAYALFRAAEARVDGGIPGAAELLREATVIATSLGAKPLTGEVEAFARRARLDIGPALTGTAVDSSSKAKRAGARPWALSSREYEVLALVAEGWTNAAIGDELFISEKTVSVHVTHILTKLGVSSRVEAALLAARAGIDQPGKGSGPRK